MDQQCGPRAPGGLGPPLAGRLQGARSRLSVHVPPAGPSLTCPLSGLRALGEARRGRGSLATIIRPLSEPT